VLRSRTFRADKDDECLGFSYMAHKLLLADDSVTIQRVIELTFADEDVDVTTVGDGQLAIERLDTDRFDIVLADVDMPKRDGYEVAAYVKSRPKLAHIPVVLLTGAFEPIDQARADAAGSSDVLAKPFEPQMVINRVKELLGKKAEDDSQNRIGPVSVPTAPAMQPRPPAHSPAEPQGQQTAGAASTVSLDDYFDQLDAAFSSLQPSAAAAAAPASDAQTAHSDMDWNSFMDPEGQPAQPVPNGPGPQAFKPVPSAPQQTTRPAAPSAWPAPPIVPVPVSSPPPAVTTSATSTPARPSATIAAWTPASAGSSAQEREPLLTSTPSLSAPAAAAPYAASVAHAPSVAHAVPVPHAAAASAAAPAAAMPSATPKPAATSSGTNPFASLSAVKAELAAAAAARPAAPVITEEIIEEVVSRVLQRLSDRVVRETVTEIVANTAERAVREEIERIKSGGE
jgi:CheY-like chemotaxis protein